MNKLSLILASSLLFTSSVYAAEFTLPQAGSFYPIYNEGHNEYIEPSTSMPFDKITTLYIAFAHVYSDENGAAFLDFEHGQPYEKERVANLIATARAVNPNIKFVISLGWGSEFNDWGQINDDYESSRNEFPNSVVQFIRENNLDGFDIDDESVSGITQDNFNAVIKNIRVALDNASVADNKAYYFTITPAFGTAEVTQSNHVYFDMINTQNYGSSYPYQFERIGVPKNKISAGINSEAGCHQKLPNSDDLAGLFNWSLSADSNCNWLITNKIAEQVDYGS